jgi:hypothetical protein
MCHSLPRTDKYGIAEGTLKNDLETQNLIRLKRAIRHITAIEAIIKNKKRHALTLRNDFPAIRIVGVSVGVGVKENHKLQWHILTIPRGGCGFSIPILAKGKTTCHILRIVFLLITGKQYSARLLIKLSKKFIKKLIFYRNYINHIAHP